MWVGKGQAAAKEKTTRHDPHPPTPPTTQLPLLSLVALGLYALALLAIGVASFRDCPSDADALQGDIKAARSDLASRGVPVATQ